MKVPKSEPVCGYWEHTRAVQKSFLHGEETPSRVTEHALYFTVTPESSTGASSDKVWYLQVLALVVTQLGHLKIAIPTIKYSQSLLTSVLAPVVTETFLKWEKHF